MYPEETYELKIDCPHSFVDRIKAWLEARGIDEYVEDQRGELDIDFEFGTAAPEVDVYEKLPQRASASLSVYKFDRTLLENLCRQLSAEKIDELAISLHAHPTKTWLEGWKDSFQPIATRVFTILPPWIDASQEKNPIIIEPGVAFGTGQHETTKLCVTALEDFLKEEDKVLDMGTGTGILAIAAEKLGARSVYAVDIDPDALIAAKGNIEANHAVRIELSSEWKNETYDLIVANILSHVLKTMISAFEGKLKSNGHLILSGLLASEEKDMLNLCRSFAHVRSYVERDWLCLVLKKL